MDSDDVSKHIRLVITGLSDVAKEAANEVMSILVKRRSSLRPGATSMDSFISGDDNDGAVDTVRSPSPMENEDDDGMEADIVELITSTFTMTEEDGGEMTADLKHCDAVLLLVNSMHVEIGDRLVRFYNLLKASSRASCVFVLPIAVDDDVKENSQFQLVQLLVKEQERWEKRIQQELKQLKKCKSTSAAIEEREQQLRKYSEKQLVFDVSSTPVSPQDAATLKSKKLIKSKLGLFLSAVLELREGFICIRSLDGHAVDHHRPRSLTNNIINDDDENSDDDPPPLPTKPPALHWTSLPSDEELQLTFRFSFLCSQMCDSDFQKLIDSLSERCSPDAQYSFRWTTGLFIQAQPVKVFIGQCPVDKKTRDKGGANDVSWRLEVSARVDVDQLTNDDSGLSPTDLLWSEIATPLVAVFDAFDSLPRLPFQVHLVPIGQMFYCKGTQKEHAFNLTYLFTALAKDERAIYCTFREKNVDGSLTENRLDLNKLLTKHRPTTIGEFRAQLLRQVSMHSGSRVAHKLSFVSMSPPPPPIVVGAHSNNEDEGSEMLDQCHDVLVKTNSGDSTNGTSSTRRLSFNGVRQNSPSSMVHPYGSRRTVTLAIPTTPPVYRRHSCTADAAGDGRGGGGRRVSFGVISVEGTRVGSLLSTPGANTPRSPTDDDDNVDSEVIREFVSELVEQIFEELFTLDDSD